MKNPPKRKPYKLSLKRRAFIAEYLKDKNATQAAIRAGYSKNCAGSIGEEILKLPEIASRIDKALRKAEAGAEITAERILKELAHMAFIDIRKAYTESGQLKDPKDWPDDIARAMAGTETYEEFMGRGAERTKIGETKKIKFWDKGRALELLGKHLKMFTDKVELGGNVNIRYTIKVVKAEAA